jgi:predicted XRE-type DNA-binding protein
VLLTDGWTQIRAAFFMHVSQSRISELRRGNIENLSLDKLLLCLSYFSSDIEIRTNRTTFKASVYPRPQLPRRATH